MTYLCNVEFPQYFHPRPNLMISKPFLLFFYIYYLYKKKKFLEVTKKVCVLKTLKCQIVSQIVTYS